MGYFLCSHSFGNTYWTLYYVLARILDTKDWKKKKKLDQNKISDFKSPILWGRQHNQIYRQL